MLINVCLSANVALAQINPNSTGRESVNDIAGLGSLCTRPRDKDEMPRTLIGHPGRDLQTNTASSSHNDIRSIGLKKLSGSPCGMHLFKSD